MFSDARNVGRSNSHGARVCVLTFLVCKIKKCSSHICSRCLRPALHLHSHPSIHLTCEANEKRRDGDTVKGNKEEGGGDKAVASDVCCFLLFNSSEGRLQPDNRVRRWSEEMHLHLAWCVVNTPRQQGDHFWGFSPYYLFI